MAKENLYMDDNQIIETVNTGIEDNGQNNESSSEVISESNENDFLEIKYNKEQIRLDREQAKELAQKGMNYEKAVERAKQEARDAYISEQGYEWNGSSITTESEYKQALREQELTEQYQQKDIPEEVIQELIENKKFRDRYESEKETQQKETNQQRDFQDFLEAYPDVKADTIPVEVWQEVEKGRSLTDAYMKHENIILRQKLGLNQKSEMIEQKNQENASASIGAVRSNGVNVPFYSKEQVTKMSTAEVNSNWKTINESMKKW
jgi:hypothetical protein